MIAVALAPEQLDQPVAGMALSRIEREDSEQCLVPPVRQLDNAPVRRLHDKAAQQFQVKTPPHCPTRAPCFDRPRVYTVAGTSIADHLTTLVDASHIQVHA
jgi:hypothetical protein